MDSRRSYSRRDSAVLSLVFFSLALHFNAMCTCCWFYADCIFSWHFSQGDFIEMSCSLYIDIDSNATMHLNYSARWFFSFVHPCVRNYIFSKLLDDFKMLLLLFFLFSLSLPLIAYSRIEINEWTIEMRRQQKLHDSINGSIYIDCYYDHLLSCVFEIIIKLTMDSEGVNSLDLYLLCVYSERGKEMNVQ